MGARLGHEEWPSAGRAGAPDDGAAPDGGAGGAGAPDGGAGGVPDPPDAPARAEGAMHVGKPLTSDRASAGMNDASLAYH